ncbi:MAG: right-handed parallel beta-helix repeat-containing protein [Bacteroidota bacterium]
MRRLLTLLCFAALLAAPASHAQQRSTPALDAEAALEARPTARPATERPVYYRYDEALGGLVLNEAGRAASAAFRADLPAVAPRAPRRAADRSARVPPVPVYRGSSLVLTVDAAFDDGGGDANPGDGVCETISFPDECQLRAAIDEANAATGPITIEFAIDDGPTGSEIAPGVWQIQVEFVSSMGPDPLPRIETSDVTIDGLTQPGASCGDLVSGPKHDLRVVLDGSLLSFGDGLSNFNEPGMTVRGLVIQNFPGMGIRAFRENSLAECNYVGTDFTGEAAAGNFDGIEVNGTTQNNLVSGNGNIGIIPYPFESGMIVQRNLVGSDADGNQPLGNGSTGIWVSGDNADINTNLASANVLEGIFLGLDPGEHGAVPSGVVLTNNTVGLTKNRGVGPGGMGAFDGILVEDDDTFEDLVDNDIGLPGAGNGNFVGNNTFGISVIGSGVSDTRIRNNTVGLALNGNAAPNGSGVLVDGDDPLGTRIGGLAAGEGNVISGNVLSGVFLGGGISTHVEGNTIGLNAAGAVRPNGQVGDNLQNSGIDVFDSFDPVIRGNTVSGNNGSGIRFAGPLRGDAGGTTAARSSAAFVVSDNRIGTTADGSAARPNVESGLVLGNSASLATVSGNTISGNTDTGVFLFGGVSGVVLENNFIGTNAAGDDLGNGIPGEDGLAGIFCQSASGVRIGQNFQPNTIRFNERDGIFLSGGCSDIAIVGNVIDSNGQLAVDLAPDGPNPNDAGDGDSGANDRLNFPVITSAENDGSNSVIAWTLNAEANTTYELLFCRNAAPDASGFGECETPNALATTTTNGSGNASGTQTLGASAYPAGSFVTANATEVAGTLPQGYRKTSEFAASVEVEDAGLSGEITIDATPTSPLTVPRGGQVSFTYVVANGTANPATGQSWFSAALQNGPTLAEGVITNGTLPSGQQVTVPYVQQVPGNAPVATYDFCLRVGLFPNVVIDEDCFEIVVTPARAASGAEAWAALEVGPWVPEPMAGAKEADEAAAPEADAVEAASGAAVPETVELAGAYPNPFGRAATVAFALPEAQHARLAVYDVLGREVARLADGELEAGRHEAVLDGAALPSGVYLVRLVAGADVRTEQVTLVR